MKDDKLIISKIKRITSDNGDIDLVLDYIFETFNDLLVLSRFDICNKILEGIDVKEFAIDSLIGMLTITADWSNELEGRKAFYQNVHNFTYSIYSESEAKAILIGLE